MSTDLMSQRYQSYWRIVHAVHIDEIDRNAVIHDGGNVMLQGSTQTPQSADSELSIDNASYSKLFYRRGIRRRYVRWF